MLIWRTIFVTCRHPSDGIREKFSVLPTQGNIKTVDLREEACIQMHFLAFKFCICINFWVLHRWTSPCCCMPSSYSLDCFLRCLILQFKGNEFQPLAFALLSNNCKIAQVLWKLPKDYELRQTFGKYCYKFQMLLGVFPTAFSDKAWKLSKAGKCI